MLLVPWVGGTVSIFPLSALLALKGRSNESLSVFRATKQIIERNSTPTGGTWVKS